MTPISPFVEQWAHGSRVYANNNERVYALDGTVVLSLVSPFVEEEKEVCPFVEEEEQTT